MIALRLAQNRPYKDAVRRALGVLALPRPARLAARCTARTVDAIWHAAGDTLGRFQLVHQAGDPGRDLQATLLYWLRDQSEDDAATLAFLDRRLAGLARVTRLRRRVAGRFRRRA